MADRLTGKASYVEVNGTFLPITKISPKVERKCADTTDTGDYVQQADMIFPTQIPVSVKTSVTAEGRYRRSSTPAAVINLLYSSVTLIPCVIGLDQATNWGHGLVDITDFTTDVPDDDVVTWTATLTSNGQWTPNS